MGNKFLFFICYIGCWITLLFIIIQITEIKGRKYMKRSTKQVLEEAKEQILEAKIKEAVRKQLEEFGVTITPGEKIPQILTLNDARIRDYIIRTKYYGKIKDEKIKKDFVKEIEEKFRNDFNSICDNILNYRFELDDGVYFCKNILDTFYEILEQYEYKQIILDMYGRKK